MPKPHSACLIDMDFSLAAYRMNRITSRISLCILDMDKIHVPYIHAISCELNSVRIGKILSEI